MNSAPFPKLLFLAFLLVQPDAAALPGGTAKHVIYLNMQGGMSPWETFDPHPKNGPAGVIQGIAPKVDISAWLPKTAQILDRCLLLRSVECLPSHVLEHTQYFRLTAYHRRSTVQHPDIGSWMKFAHPQRGPYFRILSESFTNAAFLPHLTCSPITIPHPSDVLKLSSDIGRWKMREEVESTLARLSPTPDWNSERSLSLTRFLAVKENHQALAWKDEPEEIRNRFGEHDFGRACLLARRLVEKADATFVEVGLSGWDKETDDFFAHTENLCQQLDDGFSALILDLENRGLLNTTLVVIASDYGRNPVIGEGRRRFSTTSSCAVLAGGGVRGGGIIGTNSPTNGRPIEGVISAGQFNSIIARAMQVDPYEVHYSPSQRPFSISASAKHSEVYEQIFLPE